MKHSIALLRKDGTKLDSHKTVKPTLSFTLFLANIPTVVPNTLDVRTTQSTDGCLYIARIYLQAQKVLLCYTISLKSTNHLI